MLNLKQSCSILGKKNRFQFPLTLCLSDGVDSQVGWALRVPLFVSNSTRRAGSCLYIPVGRACAGRALQATHSNSLAARRGAAPSRRSQQHASPGRGRRRRREGQRGRGEGSSEADACGRAAMALLCFLLDLRNIPPPLLHRVKQVPTTLPPARLLFLPAHPSVGGEQPQLNPVRRRGSARLCSACSTSPTSTPPQRHRPNPTPRPPPTPAGSPTAWPSATSTPPPPNPPPPGLRSVIHPPCC